MRSEGERAARRDESARAEVRRAVADADEADGKLIVRALVEMQAHFLSVTGIELGVGVWAIAIVVAAVDDERQIGNDRHAPWLRSCLRGAQLVSGRRRCVEDCKEREITGRLHAQQIL